MEIPKDNPADMLITKALETPMADVLVEAFTGLTRHDTWQYQTDYYGTAKIIAAAETLKGDATLLLEDNGQQTLPQFLLSFYSLYPYNPDWQSPDLIINAGVISRDPNLERLQYGANFQFGFGRSFRMPSYYFSWLLEQTWRISRNLSERYDPFYEQDTFTREGSLRSKS